MHAPVSPCLPAQIYTLQLVNDQYSQKTTTNWVCFLPPPPPPHLPYLDLSSSPYLSVYIQQTTHRHANFFSATAHGLHLLLANPWGVPQLYTAITFAGYSMKCTLARHNCNLKFTPAVENLNLIKPVQTEHNSNFPMATSNTPVPDMRRYFAANSHSLKGIVSMCTYIFQAFFSSMFLFRFYIYIYKIHCFLGNKHHQYMYVIKH